MRLSLSLLHIVESTSMVKWRHELVLASRKKVVFFFQLIYPLNGALIRVRLRKLACLASASPFRGPSLGLGA